MSLSVAAVPAATPSTFETPLHDQTPHVGSTPSASSTKGGTSSLSSDGARDSKQLKPEDHTLDRFLSKFESEDDASFSEIMEKTQAQQRAQYAWLFEKEKEYGRSLGAPEPVLAITDGTEGGREGQESGKMMAVAKREPEKRSGVESWTYTVKNTLMYVPDGLERSAMEKVAEPDKKREVVHSNTRLSGGFLRNMHGVMKTVTGEGEGGGGKSKDKVGVDGKVLDPSDSPQVNGYGFVATPQIQPGTYIYTQA